MTAFNSQDVNENLVSWMLHVTAGSQQRQAGGPTIERIEDNVSHTTHRVRKTWRTVTHYSIRMRIT